MESTGVETIKSEHEALAGSLQRLGFALDDLLLLDGQPDRGHLRTLRLLTVDVLHGVAAALDETSRQSWATSAEVGLRRAVADFAAVTGAATHVRVRGDAMRLSPDGANAIRQVVGEALNNVNRHARLGFLLLSLVVKSDEASLDIVDDGIDLRHRPSPAWAPSVELALRRMRSALEAVGGRLALSPLRPRGLRLRAVVPLGPGGLQ